MSSTDPQHERVEQLLAAAERVARQPVPARRTPARLQWPLIGVGAILAIVVVAAVVSGGSTGVSGQTTAVPLASTTSVVATTTPIVITLPPITTPSTDTSPPGDTGTSTATSTVTPPTGVAASPRTIAYQGGALLVQGVVADQATADAIHQALVDSFGAAAVVDQLRVVIGAPSPGDDRLTAGSAVKFQAGQAITDFASLRFLDQLADLLGRRPAVTADIHVTAEGDGAVLAGARAAVVRQYLIDRGVAADRMASAADPATGTVAELVVTLHHLPG